MKNELHLSRTFILTTFIVLLIAVVAVTSHRAFGGTSTEWL